MSQVEFEGTTLVIGDTTISVEDPIESAVTVDSVVAVLLEPQDSDPQRDNLVAYSSDGDRLWRADPVRPDASGADCYVRIWEDDGELWADSWDGVEYHIDLSSGSQLDSRFTK